MALPPQMSAIIRKNLIEELRNAQEGLKVLMSFDIVSYGMVQTYKERIAELKEQLNFKNIIVELRDNQTNFLY